MGILNWFHGAREGACHEGGHPPCVDQPGAGERAPERAGTRTELAHMLLEAKADVFFNDGTVDLSSALAMAIIQKNARLARKAIEAGADVNMRGTYGGVKITPLVEAAAQRSSALVEILIEAGADPNLAQANGETALANAAQNGDYHIAAMLLDAGANPDAITPVGTSMSVADNIGIMTLLLTSGANPDIPDCDGDTPIVGSITTRAYEASFFLSRLVECDLRHTNHAGQTPLDIALMLNDPQMTSALCDTTYEGITSTVNIDGCRQEMIQRINRLRDDGYPETCFPSLHKNGWVHEVPDEQQDAMREVRLLTNQAIEEKRAGRLLNANTLYLKTFAYDAAMDEQVNWGWVKVLLLAKNFKDAQLVMRYFAALCARENDLLRKRGVKLAEDIPKSALTFDFNGFDAFVDYTQTNPLDRQEVERRIQAFGGSPLWADYRLTTNEYDTFLRYFFLDSMYRDEGIDS